MNKQPDVLIHVKNLKKYFPRTSGFIKREKEWVQAVDDVTFSIYKGETFGLVGESGSGKSTLGRTLLKLYEPTSGEIYFDGENLVPLSRKELFPYRRRIQTVFQDPYSSLNPNHTVMEIISEPLVVHGKNSKEEKQSKVLALLRKVGLDEEAANRFPHEFSGGQRQRIGIARALIVEPDFIFCDEPVSALDVSVQAQVINLLEDLQKETGVTLLFVAHDISIVRHISDRIGVMYLGKLVEVAESDTLFYTPNHPYTKALLAAIPIPDPTSVSFENREALSGDIPSPINPPSGCRFRTRCKHAMEVCARQEPPLVEIQPNHYSACHLNDTR